MSFNLIRIRYWAEKRITEPLVASIAETGITPDILTWVGFTTALVAAALVAMGHFISGAVILLLAGVFDMLDGALARFKNQETRFGAFLDSTLDRLSEICLLLGLLIFCLSKNMTVEAVLIFIVMAMSMLVSYVRARAEGLGVRCDVGLFTRPERVIVLALGLFLNKLLPALLILAVFSCITVIQRVIKVKKETSRRHTAVI